MYEHRFKRLKVWDKTMNFIEEIYKTTQQFPPDETHILTLHLRRASLAVAARVVEGSTSSQEEFSRFLSAALKSSYDVLCGIEIARKLNYLSERDADLLAKQCNELSGMLSGLRKKIQSSLNVIQDHPPKPATTDANKKQEA